MKGAKRYEKAGQREKEEAYRQEGLPQEVNRDCELRQRMAEGRIYQDDGRGYIFLSRYIALINSV